MGRGQPPATAGTSGPQFTPPARQARTDTQAGALSGTVTEARHCTCPTVSPQLTVELVSVTQAVVGMVIDGADSLIVDPAVQWTLYSSACGTGSHPISIVPADAYAEQRIRKRTCAATQQALERSHGGKP